LPLHAVFLFGDLQVYPKLVKSYHDFLEALTQDYVVFVTNLEPDVLVYVLQTPLDGVNSLDTDIVIPACATVDKVVSHMYKRYYGVGSEAISVTSGLIENDNSLKVQIVEVWMIAITPKHVVVDPT
ncbi:hypothetical protein M513_13154, partial [Trichuris suis]